MDKLKAYLSENSIPVAAFADAIGVNVRTAYRYVDGERFPGREIMARICEWSGGKVQPNDFFRLPESHPTQEGAGADG